MKMPVTRDLCPHCASIVVITDCYNNGSTSKRYDCGAVVALAGSQRTTLCLDRELASVKEGLHDANLTVEKLESVNGAMVDVLDEIETYFKSHDRCGDYSTPERIMEMISKLPHYGGE